MERIEPIDEMADGSGQARAHWRGLMGAMFSLGREALATRAPMLERAFAEEGITAMLPGEQPVNWRCDPIPLALSDSEFTKLEAGLAQRATLMEAILDDLYGPQTLLADRLLPAELVLGNPNFLRACRMTGTARRERRLMFYAADLLRGPDGGWRVLADHTDQASGLGYALENRRILSRIIPELFQSQKIHPLRPYLDSCTDVLQSMSPSDDTTVALLTPGYSDPLWFEHVMLSRAMSMTLVEGGDLTIRDGQVFLKTLKGLQRVGVLVRRTRGDATDPLEFASNGGTPGLLAAARGGGIRIFNDVGSAVVEAPGLAAFLPSICRRLLGEDLMAPSQATMWLGEEAVVRIVLRDLEDWIIRPATDGAANPVRPTLLSSQERASLAARIAAHPERFAVAEAPTPSVAPCLGENGLEPRPVALRLFLMFDGSAWRALPGGLARALAEEDALAARLPRTALSKDVWVVADETTPVQSGLGLSTISLSIRRTAGDFPSRVADNFFWLGRYLERMEGSARLQRALMGRLARPSPSPREATEIDLLVHCLAGAGMLRGEDATTLSHAMVTAGTLRAFRAQGPMRRLVELITGQVTQLRDRLTDEMYSVLQRSLRALTERMRALPPDRESAALEAGAELTSRMLEFAATVAGLSAENMVRGGGRLFLELGRRIERSQGLVSQLEHLVDKQLQGGHLARMEIALRLALELCDSVLTYTSRYLAILQPGPALDLVLADEGNPRGLVFQLNLMRDLLGELVDENDPLLATLAPLLREPREIVHGVMRAQDQMAAMMAVPGRLRGLEASLGTLSEQVTRRFFAMLPMVRNVDDVEEPVLEMARGAI